MKINLLTEKTNDTDSVLENENGASVFHEVLLTKCVFYPPRCSFARYRKGPFYVTFHRRHSHVYY